MPLAALPDVFERFAQSSRLARRLVEHGYIRVGLDHFAKPGDALVTAPIARNFQGYTGDQAATLIGIGASAIGRLPRGYVQNAVAVDCVAGPALSGVDGVLLSNTNRSTMPRRQSEWRWLLPE